MDIDISTYVDECGHGCKSIRTESSTSIIVIFAEDRDERLQVADMIAGDTL